MEQRGIVIKTEVGQALVKITRAAACGEACGSCNLCEKREIERWVLNPLGAEKGDKVRLVQDSKGLLIMAFVAYILPVILAGAAALVFSRLIENQGARDLASFAVFVIIVLIIAKFGGKAFRGERFKSRICEIVEKGEHE